MTFSPLPLLLQQFVVLFLSSLFLLDFLNNTLSVEANYDLALILNSLFETWNVFKLVKRSFIDL